MNSWTLFFNTNKNGAESSKLLNFFIYTPLFKWDDVRWYFPGLCGVSETTMWHSRQAGWTLSLMFPYLRRMMIVLSRPLHSVVSDRNGLGIFVPLPPAILMAFTHEANIALEACLGKFCFSVLCWSCFTHGNKAPWFLFHVVLGRSDFKGFIFALCFLLLSAGCFQGSFTQGGIWFPKETRMIAEGVILDALL